MKGDIGSEKIDKVLIQLALITERLARIEEQSIFIKERLDDHAGRHKELSNRIDQVSAKVNTYAGGAAVSAPVLIALWEVIKTKLF